jgi:hypothetical protein
MSLFYFVEILNQHGEVQSRHKFSSLPIRIGRGYSNDVIVDDDKIAAEHALIEMNENGMLSLRDLGSLNGLKIKGKRHTQLHINGDTVVWLGQTQIRVRDTNYAVSADVSDSTHTYLQGWPLLANAIFILCVLSLSESWINDINESKASDYIMGILPWFVSGAVWAGVWALANRVFGGGANFNRHLFILSCGLLTAQVAEYIYIVLGFSFSWETPLLYKGHIAIAIACTTIYYHLSLITRKRALIKYLCIGTTLTISGLKLLHNYQTTNKLADELYMSETLPPAMRISRNYSLNEFDHAIHDLKKEIDAERDKALKEKAEKTPRIQP